MIGADASSIYGNLNANGQVFLVNPNGVLFAEGASVDVGGLVASSMNLSDQNFLDRDYLFEGGSGSVVNAGDISAGYLALLAPEVSNLGVINTRAGTTALAGGETVRLNITGNNLIDIEVSQAEIDTLVENRHLIQADGGQVIMSAQSINSFLGNVVNAGVIEAKGIVNDGGSVWLSASDNIDLGGSINADAAANGDGGTILAIADLDNPDSTTQVSGSLSALGGSNSGNGGFIETSARNLQVSDAVQISTAASNGRFGDWLLDPTDFTVALSGGDITGLALSTQLGGSNVTIQSDDGGSGTAGNIFINDSISWISSGLLTLDAGNNIEINAPITVGDAGGSGIALQYGQDAAGDFFNNAQIVVRAPINLTSASSFSTLFGNDGTATNFTVITDQAGLENVLLNGAAMDDYVLGSDITLTGNWTPLGDGTSTVFDGVFDGLGHSVSDLTIANTTNQSFVGLFGSVGINGVIQNLGVVNANVAGATNVGALAGENNGRIVSSYSSGTVTGSDVVGATNDSTVASIGGLVGVNYRDITLSYSSANVTATTGSQLGGGFGSGGAIGGLVGEHQGVGLDGVYATGAVSGGEDVGGLVGYLATGMSSSYSTGAVSITGGTNVGGLVGAMDFGLGFAPGAVVDTFWDTQTSGQATSASAGSNSSTGLTTAQAMQAASYGGWDSNPIYPSWVIREGVSYPLLRTFLPPLVVAADDQSKDFDGNIFGGTYTATLSNGTQINNGAGATDLTGTLTIGGAALTATDAGDYAITASGLSLADQTDQHGFLDLTYLDGTLSIEALMLTLIEAALQGSVSRQYDSSTVATLTPENFALSGFLNGDGATVTETVGVFSQANAGDLLEITVDLDASDFTPTGSTDLSNYQLPTVVSGNIGTITQRQLNVLDSSGLTVNSREYDGTLNASISGTLLPVFNGSGCATAGQACFADMADLTVAINGDGLEYSSANVADTDNFINIANNRLSLMGDAAGNYSLASNTTASVDGTGSITPRPVAMVFDADAENVVKEYDGTNQMSYGLFVNQFVDRLDEDFANWGFVGDDNAVPSFFLDALLNTTEPVDITFSDVNAIGDGDPPLTLSATWSNWVDLSSTGIDLNNYDLALSFSEDIGQIDPKEISVTLLDPDTASLGSRIYDGTTVLYDGSDTAPLFELAGLISTFGEPLPYTDWGFIAGEGAYSTATAIDFDNKNVGVDKDVTVTWGPWTADAGTATNLANYVIRDHATDTLFSLADGGSTGQLYTGLGEITPKALDVIGLSVVDRAYDGTLVANIAGFDTGTSNNLNAFIAAASGTDNDGTALLGDDVTLTGVVTGTYNDKDVLDATTVAVSGLEISGNDADNYELSALELAGSITQANIVAPEISTTVTKEYDGTTDSAFNESTLAALLELGLVSLSDDERDMTSWGFAEGEWAIADDASTLAYTDKNVASEVPLRFVFTGWTAGGNAELSNYILPTESSLGSGEITPKPLTITGTTAADRIYDGTDVAAISLGTLSGFVDTETVTATASGTFDIKDAGARTATALYQLADGTNGGLASNYMLASTEHAATISPIELSISGTTAANRDYDGTTTATITAGSLSGFLDAETVSATAIGNFDSRNVGSRTATATYSLADGENGGLAINYSLASTDGHAATISPKAVTLTAPTVSQVYNGSTAYSGDIDFSSLIAELGVDGDTVTAITLTYQDPNAGTGKAVDASDAIINDGNNGDNYSLSYVGNTDSSITPRELTISGTNALNRAYDGSTTAAIAPGILSGLVGSQTLNVTATGIFDDANVGTRIATATYSLANGANGGLANNYSLASTSGHSASITPKALSISGTMAAGRAYDGTTTATITPGTLNGLVNSQTLNVTATGFFDSDNAGSRTATANYQLADGANGGLATNYSLASTSGHAATISPRQVVLALSTDSPITKIYDGTTNYSGSVDPESFTAQLGIDGDTVTGIALAYQDPNAGSGKAVIASAATINDGNGGNNYSLSYASSNTGTITPKALTINGTSASGRVYDGITTASITPGTLSGLIGNQSLNVSATGVFGSANVGTQTATATYQLSNGANGGLAGNYSLAETTGHSAVITPSPLTITANDQDKSLGTVFNFTGDEFTTSGTLFASDQVTRVDFSSSGSPVSAGLGDYAITPSNAQGVGLTNYNISYLNGSMTVTPPTTRTLLTVVASLVKTNSAAFQDSRFLRVLRQEVNKYGNISAESAADRLIADMRDGCFGNCVGVLSDQTDNSNLGSLNNFSDFQANLLTLFNACNCSAEPILATWFANRSRFNESNLDFLDQ